MPVRPVWILAGTYSSHKNAVVALKSNGNPSDLMSELPIIN